MNWRYRFDKRKGDMGHGISFHMFERRSENTRGEAAYKDRKLHVDGSVSLTLAFDQTKYGDEMIAQVYTKDPGRVAERRADGYNRIQVYLGPADENTAATLEHMASIIRERKG